MELFSVEWWSDFVAQALGGLLAGIVVFGCGEILLVALRNRADERARRRRIFQLMHAANNLLVRAVRTERPLALTAVKDEYDALTVEAMGQFRQSEIEIARWASAEFFAAFHEASDYLDAGAPKTFKTLTGVTDAARLRFERLAGWSNYSLWPWRRDPGPIYAWEGREGDTARHNQVRPNSDVLAGSDMVWPPWPEASHERSIRDEHLKWRRNKQPWSYRS